MAVAWSSTEPRRSVTILGATGSVGRSTLDLIGCAPERYRVEALTAQQNVDALAALAVSHGARLAVIGDPAAYRRLRDALAGTGIAVAAGQEGAESRRPRGRPTGSCRRSSARPGSARP